MSHEPDRDDAAEIEILQQALAWERRLVRHWHELAESRRHDLDSLRRRTPVRLRRRFDRTVVTARRRVRAALPHRLVAAVRAAAAAVRLEDQQTRASQRDDRLVVVVTVGRGPGDDARARQQVDRGGHRSFEIVHLRTSSQIASALEELVKTTPAPLLCVIDTDVTPLTTGWLQRLVSAVHGDVAAAAPRLVEGRIHRTASRRTQTVEGITFHTRVGERMPRLVPMAASLGDGGAELRSVPVLSRACFVLDVGAARDAGGFVGGDMAALCLRLYRSGKRAAIARSVAALDARPAAVRTRDLDMAALAAAEGPRLAREVLKDRIEATRALSRSRWSAAIVAVEGDQRAARIERALQQLGWRTSCGDGTRAGVVLVMDPALMPVSSRQFMLCAVVTDVRSPWIGHPGLAAVDLAVAAGDEVVREIRRESHVPVLVADLAARPGAEALRAVLLERVDMPSFVLDVAAPSAKMAPRWGDFHLAEGLARALRGRGHDVRVQTADQWDRSEGCAYDVRVHLKGLRPVVRHAAQIVVVWSISHPEELSLQECDAADLVLVASSRFAAHLETLTETPVRVFLQATDSERFFPRSPQARFRHDVAFVGKSRGVHRPIVRDAVTAGLRPAIYGSGWEDFIDAELQRSEYVDNDLLPVLYSSVRVLLNDHWDWMREWGFVSNRIYDALACGATVISDELPEIPQLFGDAVATYSQPRDLRATVDAILSDGRHARERALRGRSVVLARHTFLHRARELVELVEPLLSERAGPDTAS